MFPSEYMINVWCESNNMGTLINFLNQIDPNTYFIKFFFYYY